MPGIEGTRTDTALADPLRVIASLFDAANQPATAGVDSDWGVESYFSEICNDPSLRERIPLVMPETVDSIPNNALCRYRGMVQDMMDPEYYVGAFKRSDGQWQTTKFSDCTQLSIEMDAESVVWERKPLYCCSIPGESDWCKPTAHAAQLAVALHPHPNNGSSKRERDENGDTAMGDCHSGQSSFSRPVKSGAQPARSSSQGSKGEHQDCSCLPPTLAPQAGDCMVYVYEREESLKLNDVVEFVGVLSRVPELAAMQLNQTADELENSTFLEEELACRPPTSQVPRIHAITARKLTGTEDLPIITYKGPAEREAQVKDLRTAAVNFLSKALYGDTLAAEYVLLQLVSRTYSRTEAAALGILSIGISGCPPAGAQVSGTALAGGSISEFGQCVASAISALTPRCTTLPVSTDQLNKATMRSGREVKSNRLTRSPLQLAENTHLVLDETLLKAGQLTALGVNNLQTLKLLLEAKKVEYDFSFYTIPVTADVPVTVLSESKSLLHASLDVTVPLTPTSSPSSVEEVLTASNGEEMNSIRAYLGLMRHMSFSIDPQMSSFLESELVTARKQNKDIDAAVMHTWLTLARLLALSHGENVLTITRWEAMKRMELVRSERARSTKL